MSARSIDAARGAAPDTKSFRGDFGFTLRVRRESFVEAEAIAQKILEIIPGEVIRIDQHIARVKMIEMPGAAVAGPDPAGRREALRAGSTPSRSTK